MQKIATDKATTAAKVTITANSGLAKIKRTRLDKAEVPSSQSYQHARCN